MQPLHPKAKWLLFFEQYHFFPFLLIFAFGVPAFFFLGLGLLDYLTRLGERALGIAEPADRGMLRFAAILFFTWAPVLITFIFLASRNYKNYKYQMTEKAIKIERGVFTRDYIYIPYERIQNVGIDRWWFPRLLGISILEIHTAGYSGIFQEKAEGRLPGIDPKLAEQLKEEVVRKSKQYKVGELGEVAEISGEDIQQPPESLHPKAKWLFFIQMEFVGAVGAILMGVVMFLPIYLALRGRYGETIPQNEMSEFSSRLILVMITTILYMIGSFPYSVWAYKNYRYRLTKTKLEINKGIIHKQHISIPYERIQNVEIHRGIFERFFGLSGVHVQTAGYSGPRKVEGHVPGLDPQTAEQLREELIKKVKGTKQGL